MDNRQLDLLIELQELDLQIRGLEEKKAEVPRKIDYAGKELYSCLESLESLKRDAEQIEKERRQRERDTEEVRGALTKIQQKSVEVKTNKEYAAVVTEVEFLKEKIFNAEEEILALMEKAEEKRVQIHLKEESASGKKLEFEREKSELLKEDQALDNELGEYRKGREGLVANLDKSLYRTYQRVVSMRGGLGVARIREGICQGCHLRVRPQLVVEVKSRTAIIQCSNCDRFLYWAEEPVATPEEAVPGGAQEA